MYEKHMQPPDHTRTKNGECRERHCRGWQLGGKERDHGAVATRDAAARRQQKPIAAVHLRTHEHQTVHVHNIRYPIYVTYRCI